MEEYKRCPKCKWMHENISVVYCECCGMHIDKYWNEQIHQKLIYKKEENHKNGSFDKNFFRGR